MDVDTKRQEETINLDVESLEALEIGIKSLETEPLYTWEEAKQFARQRRKEWASIPESLAL